MLNFFRWIGRCEGISFLLLVGIAMPLKYIWGWPEAVKVVGMAHGILFIVYIAMVNYVAIEEKWAPKLWLGGMFAGVIPCGTFIFEKRYLPQSQTSKV